MDYFTASDTSDDEHFKEEGKGIYDLILYNNEINAGFRNNRPSKPLYSINDLLNIELKDKTKFKLVNGPSLDISCFTVLNMSYIEKAFHEHDDLLAAIDHSLLTYGHYIMFFKDTDFNNYNKSIETFEEDERDDDQEEQEVVVTKKKRNKVKSIFEGEEGIYNGMRNSKRKTRFIVIKFESKNPVKFMKIDKNSTRKEYTDTYKENVIRLANGLWVLDMTRETINQLEISKIHPFINIKTTFNVNNLIKDMDKYYENIDDGDSLYSEDFVITTLNDIVSTL